MRIALEPRAPSALAGPLAVAAGLAAAAIAAVALFSAAGAPPAAVLTLVSEPLGSAWGLSETLVKTVPLGFCALAVALALKIGLWNIGAEGQLYAGAAGATWAALTLPAGGWPVALAAGALCGGLWALAPGLLKVRAGVSEILSTLMLNYVAIAGVEYLVFGPWKGADGFPYTAVFAEPWRLPILARRVHLGLVLLAGLALALWLLERRSRAGFEVRVAGASPEAARYAGMPVQRRLVQVLLLAGAAAGLAGAAQVCGVEHRLHAGISPGYGYTAIIVAFLARRWLLLSLGVAFLLAALAVGGDGLAMNAPGVSPAVVEIVQALVLLFALAGDALARWRPVVLR